MKNFDGCRVLPWSVEVPSFSLCSLLRFFWASLFLSTSGRAWGSTRPERKKLNYSTAFFAVAQLDIQLAISFLCKRVKNPNTGDWVNLGRVVRYIRATVFVSIGKMSELFLVVVLVFRRGLWSISHWYSINNVDQIRGISDVFLCFILSLSLWKVLSTWPFFSSFLSKSLFIFVCAIPATLPNPILLTALVPLPESRVA